MKEYEVVFTYLNGCAGEAYPVTTIEEIEAASPESWLQGKFGKDFVHFTREVLGEDRVRFRFETPTVVYIYEFTEL